MLRISQRDCKLGDKYAGKKDTDGDAVRFKVQLEDIMLDRTELNALLGQPHAYETQYDTSAEPHKPYLTGVEPVRLSKPWEGGFVVLWYEFGKSKVELKNAKISNIEVQPRLGGDSALSCTVEGEPALDEKLAKLIDIIARTGGSIECEITADRPDDQKDLPLNQHGVGEQPEAGRRKNGKRNGHHPTA